MAGSKLVIGLAAGALIGAAAGLLIAPKAGSESRQMIASRVGRFQTGARGQINKLRRPSLAESEEETGNPVNGVVS